MKIVIDPEFRELLPRASEEELSRLRERIEAEGCRDAVVVWKETGILLDGHKRKSICDPADLPYQVVYLEFAARDAALRWVVNNQLARRNLTAEQRAYYIGKDYLAAKKTVGNPQLRQNDAIGKPSGNPQKTDDEPKKRTSAVIAEKHGVSPRTVERSADFAEAVDALPVEEKAAVISGKKKTKEKPACDRCRRIGKPVKDCPHCPQCKELRRKPTVREELQAAVDADPEEPPTVEEQIKEANKALEAWCRDLKAHVEALPADPWLNDLNRRNTIEAQVKALLSTVRSAKCSKVCPACSGGCCGKCHKTGRVTEYTYQQLGGE